MADTKMLAEKVEAARQLVPAMLRDVKPDVLASSILPTLLKPWPDSSRAAFGVGNDEEPRRSLASPSKLRHMRADYLPLLQEDQYVVCKSCGRTLLLDVFDEHIRVCASLPIALLQSDEMRASSPVGGGKPTNRAKSASPVPPGSRERPPSGQGGKPPKMAKRGTPPPGQHAGAKGAAERRLQFERGELSIDAVCGVMSGDKVRLRELQLLRTTNPNPNPNPNFNPNPNPSPNPSPNPRPNPSPNPNPSQVCLHKLNCKYHNLALKRMVPARPHPHPHPHP